MAIPSPVVSLHKLRKILAILHLAAEILSVLSALVKLFANACLVCLVIHCLLLVANLSVSDRMIAPSTWLVSMPNVRILAPELVELALNVPWKITIQFVVVLQDTLAILLIDV